MRISARADYAIRALLELAVDTSRPLTCEGIAQSQEIPHRFLKAVFRDLRRAELVRSQRGCEGGYWLSRDAASISLAAIVAAVDGQLMTVHGESPGDQRYPGPAARLSEFWTGLQRRYEDILAGVSLADLLADEPPEPAVSLLRDAALST
ncbi:Rrf2 family transcriptional regulator [Actinomadura sp. DC4]|uniref:RrF2 family transcriptional regulator n=1 Tax=Actinomadura sp. DC4 TaxID=3055069 RepID=UPI0025B18CDB|nr:Rrf2 family transcriptional regulator [Actinomadura sp. DC4]MDN3356389.1 Rrf2 family transcriptional regulator [Actinomadura sp. DC4]